MYLCYWYRVKWRHRKDLVDSLNVQMERWDDNVLNINNTCRQLGSKFLQLLRIHALSGCHTTSYPFGKGVMMSRDCPRVHPALSESTATHFQLMEVGGEFFTALYGQQPGTSMASARYNLYILKNGKPLNVMYLPHTEANLLLPVLCSHLQLLLGKSADKNAPPACTYHLDQYGWNRGKGGIISPVQHTMVVHQLHHIMDVISCRCRAEGRACGAEICSPRGLNPLLLMHG